MLRKFKNWCCQYAPAIIVFDVILIVILIVEFTLLVPNKHIKNHNSLFVESEEDAKIIAQRTKGLTLWKLSSYAIFIIPAITILITCGIRVLFCKISINSLKVSIISIVFFIYIVTLIGGIVYYTMDNKK